MQRVAYYQARSLSNCHNLLLISDCWQSRRICAEVVGFDALVICDRSTRTQSLVWSTLCEFILVP